MDSEQFKNEETSHTSDPKWSVALMLLFAFPLLVLVFRKAFFPAQKAYPVISSQKDEGEDHLHDQKVFDSLIRVSMDYIQSGRPEASINILKQALIINPNSSVAYNNLGFAYTLAGQVQNGINACETALSIAPDFRLAANNLKWALEEKIKLKQKIEGMESIPSEAKDIPFYLSLGMNYLNIGEYDQSIQSWNNILKKDPENADALNNIGVAYMMKEQYDEAIRIFRKVCNKNPGYSLAKNNLNWAQSEKHKALKKSEQYQPDIKI